MVESSVEKEIMTLREWFKQNKRHNPKWMENYIVIIDKDVNLDCSERRKYCRLRGKPVTRKQGVEINKEVENSMVYYELPMFVFEDGTVGLNFVTGKYEAAICIVKEMACLLNTFPYLDMMLLITNWDEQPDFIWRFFCDCYGPDGEIIVSEEVYQQRLSEYNAIRKTEAYEEIYDLRNIDFGVQIQGKIITILNSENAIKVYKEYEKKYEVDDKEIYVSLYFD